MTATPNPIVNLVSVGDPNDWAASAGGLVAPGAAGVPFSFGVAFSIYKATGGTMSFVDNLAANTGFSITVDRTFSADGDELCAIEANFGNGVSNQTIATDYVPSSAFLGYNFFVGVRKDANEVCRLYVNGGRQGQITLDAYAAAIQAFGLLASGEIECGGISSFFFYNNVLLSDDTFANIHDLWRTQGRLFEVVSEADLLNLGVPNWAYEAADTVVPVATQDLTTMVNLGSAGSAGDLTTAEDHEVGFRIDQIVTHTAPWGGGSGSGGATGTANLAQYSASDIQGGITGANVPLEVFETTEFGGADFTITSPTQLTADLTGTYRVTAVAELAQSAGAALEAVTLEVQVDGVSQKDAWATIDGTAGSGHDTLTVGPFIMDLTAGQVVTLDFGGNTNTYSLAPTNSYMLLERLD